MNVSTGSAVMGSVFCLGLFAGLSPQDLNLSESYLITGETLCETAEKVVYKKTPQGELLLYILRPREGLQGYLPAIVYFTGGGWVGGEPRDQIANAAWFRDRGMIGITADYRVRSRQGTTPLECVKDAKSAIRCVRGGLPPTVLSCGTEDDVTPYGEAERFVRLMKEAGNACELITIPGAGHSCDWPATNPHFLPTLKRMVEFLEEHGFMPNRGSHVRSD